MSKTDSLLPVWLKPAQVHNHYQIARSTLYVWIKEGLIKTTTTRVDKHQKYGSRLINRASLEAFLEARASGGEDNDSV